MNESLKQDAAELADVALAATDEAEGRTARVNRDYKPKSAKDSRTKRRGKGGKGKAKNTVPEAAQAAAGEETSDTDTFAALEQKLNTHRSAQDGAHGAILSVRNRIQNPSPEMVNALETYRSAERELVAHEEAHEAYARDAAGIAEAEKEVALLKESLKAAETFLSLAAAHPENVDTEHSEAKDATPAEQRRSLRAKVAEMGNLTQAQERLFGKEDAEGLQKKYFDALKAHNRKRNAISVAAADLVGESALTPKQLKEMRKEWIASRAGIAKAMHESVDARLKATPSAAREAMLERMREKYGNVERTDIHARFVRLYGRNAIVLDAERAELAAREEGLSEREKGILDKMYEGYKNLPPGVRILSTTALMFGAGAAIAGTPIGWTALGMAGGGALLRWAAEARKNKVLGAAATGLSIGGLVGLGLDKLAGASHHVLGTKKQAEKTLAQKENFGDLTNVKNLEKLANKRKSALVAEKNIERHRRWARILGSVGAGWLFGSMAGNENAADNGNTESEGVSQESNTTETRESGPTSEASGVAARANAETQDTSVMDRTPEAPAAVEHVSVIERGEGFNTLFAEIQSGVREAGDTSPLATHLLSMSPTELSDLVNAYDPETGGSMVMQPGDKLYVEGDTLIFERGGETRVLMEVENGQVQTHAFEDPQMMGMHAVAESVRTPAPEAATEVEAPSEPLAPMQPELVATAPATPEEVVSAAPVSAPEAPAVPAQEFEGFPRAELTPPTDIGSGTGMLQTRPLEDYSNTDTAEASLSADGFVNGNGVEVVAAEPHVYALPMPGSDQVLQTVFGGSESAVRAEALAQLELNPAAELYVTHTEVNPATGTPETYLGMWHMNAEGQPEFEPVVMHPETGARVGAADPDQFTRRID